MSMAPTRFGANDPSMPAVLPILTSALSRRKAIFGAVALGVAPAAAMPAVSSDAELFDLLAQHPVAVERWHAAERATHRLEQVAIAARPERPEALSHRAGDLGGRGLGLVEVEEPADEGGVRHHWYGERGLAWLAEAGAFMRYAGEDAEGRMIRRRDHEAQARRGEILAAGQAYAAACQKVDLRVGLTAAQDAVEVAYAALEAIEDRLSNNAPRTLAGLAAKAAWAAGSEDEGVMEAVLHQVAAFSLAS